jgi:hypothetical protein
VLFDALILYILDLAALVPFVELSDAVIQRRYQAKADEEISRYAEEAETVKKVSRCCTRAILLCATFCVSNEASSRICGTI